MNFLNDDSESIQITGEPYNAANMRADEEFAEHLSMGESTYDNILRDKRESLMQAQYDMMEPGEELYTGPYRGMDYLENDVDADLPPEIYGVGNELVKPTQLIMNVEKFAYNTGHIAFTRNQGYEYQIDQSDKFLDTAQMYLALDKSIAIDDEMAVDTLNAVSDVEYLLALDARLGLSQTSKTLKSLAEGKGSEDLKFPKYQELRNQLNNWVEYSKQKEINTDTLLQHITDVLNQVTPIDKFVRQKLSLPQRYLEQTQVDEKLQESMKQLYSESLAAYSEFKLSWQGYLARRGRALQLNEPIPAIAINVERQLQAAKPSVIKARIDQYNSIVQDEIGNVKARTISNLLSASKSGLDAMIQKVSTQAIGDQESVVPLSNQLQKQTFGKLGDKIAKALKNSDQFTYAATSVLSNGTFIEPQGALKAIDRMTQIAKLVSGGGGKTYLDSLQKATSLYKKTLAWNTIQDKVLSGDANFTDAQEAQVIDSLLSDRQFVESVVKYAHNEYRTQRLTNTTKEQQNAVGYSVGKAISKGIMDYVEKPLSLSIYEANRSAIQSQFDQDENRWRPTGQYAQGLRDLAPSAMDSNPIVDYTPNIDQTILTKSRAALMGNPAWNKAFVSAEAQNALGQQQQIIENKFSKENEALELAATGTLAIDKYYRELQQSSMNDEDEKFGTEEQKKTSKQFKSLRRALKNTYFDAVSKNIPKLKNLDKQIITAEGLELINNTIASIDSYYKEKQASYDIAKQLVRIPAFIQQQSARNAISAALDTSDLFKGALFSSMRTIEDLERNLPNDNQIGADIIRKQNLQAYAETIGQLEKQFEFMDKSQLMFGQVATLSRPSDNAPSVFSKAVTALMDASKVNLSQDQKHVVIANTIYTHAPSTVKKQLKDDPNILPHLATTIQQMYDGQSDADIFMQEDRSAVRKQAAKPSAREGSVIGKRRPVEREDMVGNYRKQMDVIQSMKQPSINFEADQPEQMALPDIRSTAIINQVADNMYGSKKKSKRDASVQQRQLRSRREEKSTDKVKGLLQVTKKNANPQSSQLFETLKVISQPTQVNAHINANNFVNNFEGSAVYPLLNIISESQIASNKMDAINKMSKLDYNNPLTGTNLLEHVQQSKESGNYEQLPNLLRKGLVDSAKSSITLRTERELRVVDQQAEADADNIEISIEATKTVIRDNPQILDIIEKDNADLEFISTGELLGQKVGDTINAVNAILNNQAEASGDQQQNTQVTNLISNLQSLVQGVQQQQTYQPNAATSQPGGQMYSQDLIQEEEKKSTDDAQTNPQINQFRQEFDQKLANISENIIGPNKDKQLRGRSRERSENPSGGRLLSEKKVKENVKILLGKAVEHQITPLIKSSVENMQATIYQEIRPVFDSLKAEVQGQVVQVQNDLVQMREQLSQTSNTVNDNNATQNSYIQGLEEKLTATIALKQQVEKMEIAQTKITENVAKTLLYQEGIEIVQKNIDKLGQEFRKEHRVSQSEQEEMKKEIKRTTSIHRQIKKDLTKQQEEIEDQIKGQSNGLLQMIANLGSKIQDTGTDASQLKSELNSIQGEVRQMASSVKTSMKEIKKRVDRVEGQQHMRQQLEQIQQPRRGGSVMRQAQTSTTTANVQAQSQMSGGGGASNNAQNQNRPGGGGGGGGNPGNPGGPGGPGGGGGGGPPGGGPGGPQGGGNYQEDERRRKERARILKEESEKNAAQLKQEATQLQSGLRTTLDQVYASLANVGLNAQQQQSLAQQLRQADDILSQLLHTQAQGMQLNEADKLELAKHVTELTQGRVRFMEQVEQVKVDRIANEVKIAEIDMKYKHEVQMGQIAKEEQKLMKAQLADAKAKYQANQDDKQVLQEKQKVVLLQTQLEEAKKRSNFEEVKRRQDQENVRFQQDLKASKLQFDKDKYDQDVKIAQAVRTDQFNQATKDLEQAYQFKLDSMRQKAQQQEKIKEFEQEAERLRNQYQFDLEQRRNEHDLEMEMFRDRKKRERDEIKTLQDQEQQKHMKMLDIEQNLNLLYQKEQIKIRGAREATRKQFQILKNQENIRIRQDKLYSMQDYFFREDSDKPPYRAPPEGKGLSHPDRTKDTIVDDQLIGSKNVSFKTLASNLAGFQQDRTISSGQAMVEHASGYIANLKKQYEGIVSFETNADIEQFLEDDSNFKHLKKSEGPYSHGDEYTSESYRQTVSETMNRAFKSIISIDKAYEDDTFAPAMAIAQLRKTVADIDFLQGLKIDNEYHGNKESMRTFKKKLEELREQAVSYAEAAPVYNNTLKERLIQKAQVFINSGEENKRQMNNAEETIKNADKAVLNANARLGKEISAQVQKTLKDMGIDSFKQQSQQQQNPYQQQQSQKNFQNNGYPGQHGRMRYADDRVNQVFGGGQQQWTQNQPSQQQRRGQQQQEQDQPPGEEIHANQYLVKLAEKARNITEADIVLLQSVVIDKESGHAMKIDQKSGQVVDLTEDESEKVALIIIEILMYFFAKYVESATKEQIDEMHKALKDGAAEDETNSVAILKVANSLANKISMGRYKPATIQRYISALVDTIGGGESSTDATEDGESAQKRQRTV